MGTEVVSPVVDLRKSNTSVGEGAEEEEDDILGDREITE
jgi:hypothetical protein